MVDNICRVNNIEHARWTGQDVVKILLWILATIILVFIASDLLFGNGNRGRFFFITVTSIIVSILPPFWLKKKYHLPKQAIGLTKRNLSCTTLIASGVLVGIIFSFLIYLTPLVKEPFFEKLRYFPFSPGSLVSPFTSIWCVSLVLPSISEEILYRGFVYGYSRTRWGVLNGLILQALLFSSAHFYGLSYSNFIIRFVGGIAFGVLYEFTGSLYPSMISHGIVNYCIAIFAKEFVP